MIQSSGCPRSFNEHDENPDGNFCEADFQSWPCHTYRAYAAGFKDGYRDGVVEKFLEVGKEATHER